MLDKFERKLRQIEIDEEYENMNKVNSKKKQESKFSLKIKNRILKNIQIKVKNVYLRFDDSMIGMKN